MSQSRAYIVNDTLYSSALEYAYQRIINPPESLRKRRIPGSNPLKYVKKSLNASLEHHVASWATTMLFEHFARQEPAVGAIAGSPWIITPEQRDSSSGRIPDLCIEKMTETDKGPVPVPWLCMEFKKFNGDNTHHALDQLIDSVRGKLFEEDSYTIYLVTVTGTKISFFEFDLDSDDLQEDCPDYNSCVSLLQDNVRQESGEPPYTIGKGNIPKGVLTIDGQPPDPRLFKKTDNPGGYPIPATFDLRDQGHKKAIYDLFQHMATHKARAF